MNKTLWIVVGVIVVAALVGWGIWSYTSMQNGSISQQPATPTSTATGSVAGPGEHCGGNMLNAPTCGQGYQCEPEPGSHLPFGDVGGICVAQTSSSSGTTGMNMNTSVSSTPTSTAGKGASSAVGVTIAGFAFSPALITVHKGTTVTWTNDDSAPHTVTGDSGGPSSNDLSKGDKYSYTFDTVGTFPYHCSVHPNMKGTVIVVE